MKKVAYILLILVIPILMYSCQKENIYGNDHLSIIRLDNVKVFNYGNSENFCGYILISNNGGNVVTYNALNVPDSLKGWQGNKRYEMLIKPLNEYTICQDPNVDPIGNDYPAGIYQMVEILEVKLK